MLFNGKTPLFTDASNITDEDARELMSKIGGLIYPVDSLYISKGTERPAEIFGGTWELIAENVILPLGDAPVITKNGWDDANNIENVNPLFWRTKDGSDIGNYTLTIQRRSGGVPYGYTIGRGTSGDAYNPQFAPSNLWADLTKSTNAMTVNIWQRVFDENN